MRKNGEVKVWNPGKPAQMVGIFRAPDKCLNDICTLEDIIKLARKHFPKIDFNKIGITIEIERKAKESAELFIRKK